MLIDDLSHNRQSKPGAALFGREKGVEYLREREWLDSRSGVFHLETCLVAVVGHPHTQRASFLHRLEPVHHEIEDHLLELFRVAQQHAVAAEIAPHENTAGGGRPLLQVEHFFDQFTEMNQLPHWTT